MLLKADYDQLELRLIAYVYGVAELIRALDDGADIHLLTAAALFRESGVTLDADAKDPRIATIREAAKSCAYGISYQMHSERGMGRYPQLYKALKDRMPAITEQKVAVLAKRFFELYPEIKRGQLKTRETIDRYGYRDLPINGRRLYYPPTMRGYNQALNFPMQATGAALLDRAVVELDAQLDWERGEQIRAQVHDELVVQAPYETAHLVAEKIERAMARPATIGVVTAGIPAAADPGLDWRSCMEWGKFCAERPGLLQERPQN